MKKDTNHGEIRQKLMDAAISVIASDGIEGATSKKIAAKAGFNEAYIYRYFFDMKDLKKSAFFREEEHMLKVLCESLSEYRKTEPTEVCQRKIFLELWEMLMQNRDVTLFLMRYFLSTECRDDVMDNHIDNFIRYCLPDEDIFVADKKAREGSAYFMTVCQYASFIHCKMLEDTEEFRERILKHII